MVVKAATEVSVGVPEGKVASKKVVSAARVVRTTRASPSPTHPPRHSSRRSIPNPSPFHRPATLSPSGRGDLRSGLSKNRPGVPTEEERSPRRARRPTSGLQAPRASTWPQLRCPGCRPRLPRRRRPRRALPPPPGARDAPSGGAPRPRMPTGRVSSWSLLPVWNAVVDHSRPARLRTVPWFCDPTGERRRRPHLSARDVKAPRCRLPAPSGG